MKFDKQKFIKLYEQPLGLGGVLMVGTEIMYLRILRLINSRLKSSQSIALKVFKAKFKENNNSGSEETSENKNEGTTEKKLSDAGSGGSMPQLAPAAAAIVTVMFGLMMLYVRLIDN